MRIIQFMQGEGDWTLVAIIIFIAVGFIGNVIKKVMQSSQGSSGKPSPAKPRSRFLDLIEEVRKMAEEGGEMKPKTPGQQPPIITLNSVEITKPQQTIVPPVVPRLKPVGSVKKPEVALQKPKMAPATRPYYTEELAAKWIVPYEEEMEEERKSSSAAGREIEEREKALVAREEALKSAEEQLSKLRSEIGSKGILPEERRKEAPKKTAELGALKDYTSVFESPELLKEAIILREILGQPRAMRRHSASSR